MNMRFYGTVAIVAALAIVWMLVGAKAEPLPDALLGVWCGGGIASTPNLIFYRPSFANRQHCSDMDDGITISATGFENDTPADSCREYVFDKAERTPDGYVIAARLLPCVLENDPDKPDDYLSGTWRLQLTGNDEVLIFRRMPQV